MAAVSRCFGRITGRAQSLRHRRRWLLSPMRLNPLLGATTHASDGGRFKSLRKYSNTVGCSGGSEAKLLMVSYTPVSQAGGGHVVAQDSAVHHLGEES